MSWVEPLFSKTKVDAAGDLLVSESPHPYEYEVALEVLNNWRSSHSFPLNTFQTGLRAAAERVDRECFVAQRLKRVPSILQKLQLLPEMQLSRMQDIGGCRAVVHTVAQAKELRETYRTSRMKHILVGEKDYISSPKASGYRGVHLVYRYRSDRSKTFNGLQVEIQIRSLLEHAWATAVETVSIFLDQALKSSVGPAPWLRFFALTGSAFAQREGTTLVPSTPADMAELARELSLLMQELDVTNTLSAYGKALHITMTPDFKGKRFFILHLDTRENSLTVHAYRQDELPTASSDYLELEKGLSATPGAQVVLVSVDSLQSLRRSYPNYFLNTDLFLDELKVLVP